MGKEKNPLEEPSVLDYLKALVTPWKDAVPAIPPLPDKGIKPKVSTKKVEEARTLNSEGIDWAAIPWASSLQVYNRLSPNMLLYWNLLEYAADNGFRHFDFGRSTPDEGTYAFKKQWGAQAMPLHWYRQELEKRRSFESGTEGHSRAILEHLWRTLPVAVANVAGPRIRKYISK